MQHSFPFEKILYIIGSIYILLLCSCDNDIVYSILMARPYLIPKANINHSKSQNWAKNNNNNNNNLKGGTSLALLMAACE